MLFSLQSIICFVTKPNWTVLLRQVRRLLFCGCIVFCFCSPSCHSYGLPVRGRSPRYLALLYTGSSSPLLYLTCMWAARVCVWRSQKCTLPRVLIYVCMLYLALHLKYFREKGIHIDYYDMWGYDRKLFFSQPVCNMYCFPLKIVRHSSPACVFSLCVLLRIWLRIKTW